MIEYLAAWVRSLFGDVWGFLSSNFDPVTDVVDVLVVAFGVYWLLLLVRGTRAVQILVGLVILAAAFLASQAFQLATLSFILNNFLSYGVLIIIIIFQPDIRRALARMGRGLFRSVSARQEAQVVEEVVRAAQILAQKRVGALIVLGRETGLGDLIEAGSPVDAVVNKEILVSIFLPYSPLHDGAVVIEDGRVAYAGCILPLTLRQDLPEGVGTRHRAAVGITEETDAAVIVVSEETASISLVVAGRLFRELDAPHLRGALRDLLTSGHREPELPLPKVEADPTGGPGPAAEPEPAVEASAEAGPEGDATPEPATESPASPTDDEPDESSVVRLPRGRSRRGRER
ncbi:MAG: diadenylate cyclase CdaA [Myxococcota bacterium]